MTPPTTCHTNKSNSIMFLLAPHNREAHEVKNVFFEFTAENIIPYWSTHFEYHKPQCFYSIFHFKTMVDINGPSSLSLSHGRSYLFLFESSVCCSFTSTLFISQGATAHLFYATSRGFHSPTLSFVWPGCHVGNLSWHCRHLVLMANQNFPASFFAVILSLFEARLIFSDHRKGIENSNEQFIWFEHRR